MERVWRPPWARPRPTRTPSSPLSPTTRPPRDPRPLGRLAAVAAAAGWTVAAEPPPATRRPPFLGVVVPWGRPLPQATSAPLSSPHPQLVQRGWGAAALAAAVALPPQRRSTSTTAATGAAVAGRSSAGRGRRPWPIGWRTPPSTAPRPVGTVGTAPPRWLRLPRANCGHRSSTARPWSLSTPSPPSRPLPRGARKRRAR